VLQVPLPGVAGPPGEGDPAVELGVPERRERDGHQVRDLGPEFVAQQEEEDGLDTGRHDAGHDVPRRVRTQLVVAFRIGGEQPVLGCAPGGGHDPNLPSIHKIMNVLNRLKKCDPGDTAGVSASGAPGRSPATTTTAYAPGETIE